MALGGTSILDDRYIYVTLNVEGRTVVDSP